MLALDLENTTRHLSLMSTCFVGLRSKRHMTSRQDTETERMIEEVGVAMQEEMLRTFVRSSFTVDQVVIQQAMHVTMQ